MRGGGRVMLSVVFCSVVSYVALCGVLSPLLLLVVCCSMLSGGMIVSFCDLLSVEDGRMIDSLEKLVV